MPFPDCVPELTDGVVRLRAHRLDDVDGIVEQSVDPESLRWTTIPSPYAELQARDFLDRIEQQWNADPVEPHWAVCAADDPDGRYLGTIDLRRRGGSLAAVGYGLCPEGRGRHLMSGALRLVVRWWFDTQAGTRITWTAFGGNLASWAVARSAGFRFDTVQSGCATFRTGEITDEWHGSIDAGEPAGPRAPWFDPPVLEGHGIRLRPWRDEDGAAVEPPRHPSHFVPEAGIPTPSTFPAWLARRRLSLARGVGLNWCIADSVTDRALGDVCVFVHAGALAPGGEAEFGYLVFPSARGRGVGAAAAQLAVRHALTPVAPGDLTGRSGLGVRRLVAVTAADNDASNRILERAGFTVWGREGAAEAPDASVGPALHWEVLA
ncbi:MAG: GNAT family N-acetyltransferase [Dermatophilaceae bacterium]